MKTIHLVEIFYPLNRSFTMDLCVKLLLTSNINHLNKLQTKE